jgi:copper oxidase (laccase) domain-containing protein
LADTAAQAVEAVRSSALEGVPHGFLARTGGVSSGLLASLNCGPGSGDDMDAVAENRERAVAAIAPGARLVSVYQVHSAICVTVKEPWADDARPEADALVTNRPGLVLGILTADCAPVLLADRQALGASRNRTVAAIGPCIAQASYEVDREFHDRLISHDATNAGLLAPGAPGHYQFDLESYVARRLAAEGIAKIDPLGLDTYSQPERFYSYRRCTHRGEPGYGRQISLIAAS